MKERMLIEFFAMTLGVFFVTWLILRKLIPVLKSRKIGQKTGIGRIVAIPAVHDQFLDTVHRFGRAKLQKAPNIANIC